MVSSMPYLVAPVLMILLFLKYVLRAVRIAVWIDASQRIVGKAWCPHRMLHFSASCHSGSRHEGYAGVHPNWWSLAAGSHSPDLPGLP